METIKTACMVIVLMAVAYGVYHHLNQPEETAPKLEIEGLTGGDTAPAFAGSPSPGGSLAPSYSPPSASPSPGSLASNDVAPPLGTPSTGTAAPTQSMSAAPSFDAPHDHKRHTPLIEAEPVGQSSLASSTAPTQPAPTSTYGASSYDAGGSKYGGASYNAVVSDESAYQNAAAASAGYGGMEAQPASANMRPNFEADWKIAQTQLEQNQWAEALRTLTPWRGRAELTTEQSEKLNMLLSQLAGSVVYSTEHLLADPYVVQRGETLNEIAEKHQVPPILLQRINGISNPELLSANDQLKVMQGPFTATISLASRELTLTVDGCFAGKFPVTILDAASVQPGEHQVIRKEDPSDRYSAQPGSYGQASGGVGENAVYLDGGVALHGESSGSTGSIQLSPRDAEDLFGILSVGSKVTIRR
ncbi:LysM peptidoglycan-binding domain-containing protein [Blastopirellula sp. JC732]|uniref:LysM peptidoglycan-binding domain-containing protein n=1 Tax=Blastopirellula sediminis TaxID=2894196 RepID=A0A9X1MPJ9_9BACT|nr:LysM peptidoglycan-binding domain-containing protein [Blastopirellula sediminis]MCC9606326.1 LysM peptidoglycan-binding domain-containing protein [Blastopirellula sediminis]MCC9630376.1 LysM peptidoglycan-binding domain-containing protein [Blastopirellula sediminis]